jgi:hypothetical protein
MDIAIRNGDGVDYTFTRKSLDEPLVCPGVPDDHAAVLLSPRNARLFYALGTDAPLARKSSVDPAEEARLRAEAKAEAEAEAKAEAAKQARAEANLEAITGDAAGTVLTPTPPAPATEKPGKGKGK